ncbi:MAG: UDP-N-acetylmuramate--L-alanine ligase [Clostridiales bacterium]|nr:UDP-N-acetylmuramate--L-alanine ligase [Clostridiales bacterium]MBR0468854.1 UDP-N-acetylmuramate--L-alanine ligase [Mogibacterium sp.]
MDFSSYKRVHCLGIGGIGLSAVAEILLDRGYIVSGTDIHPSKVTRHLEYLGIKVFTSHEPENVEGVDAVVYSAAVSDENPEVKRARELGIPLYSRAEVLGMIMNDYENSVAICGTHGKTTVTSMTSLILRNAEYKPTILVGGNLPQINGNVEIGGTKYFVTEACEYMDSFLQLRPSIGVILNIDSDHLDYFKDMEHIVKSFSTFVEQIPPHGIIIAFGDNPFVRSILKEHNNKITYGYSESNDFYAENIKFNENGFPVFDICHKGMKAATVELNVPGEHNVLNAMAAFVTSSYLGVDTETIVSTLKEYSGANRRFDYIGTTDKGVKVIDDYAHHPTEIKATLSAAGNVKHNKLWLIFQPHTYTRTKALFSEFVDAFGDADVVILTDIYAAREKDVYNISSYKLVTAIKAKHPDKPVYYVKDFEDIVRYIEKFAGKDDIVMTMGAGDVYKVGDMLLHKDEQ